MFGLVISDDLKKDLEAYLKKHRKIDLISAYLYFVQQQYKISPVAYPKEKKIYQSREDVTRKLESQGQLWRETEVKISVGQPTVNAETKKIYICPFCGKVFGDNTHPNPLDAIYDEVSKCTQNTELVDGLKPKRFDVSEDPEMIKNYITKPKSSIKKVAYSSLVSGKLFNSKAAVVTEFQSKYLRGMSLIEVQNQNRFEIDDKLLEFIHTHLQEEKIAKFVDTLSKDPTFDPHVSQWFEDNEKETAEDKSE